MAQPAQGPVEAPCPTPPVHAHDAVTSVHPVDEKLHLSRLAPVALRHIAAMYAGVVTPALIIGQACGLGLAARTRLIAAIPLAAPTFHAGFPAWAQTVLGSGISAGALVAVLLNLFFHHLGTRSRQPAPALKSP
nr:hypothetical protein [Streptomyces durhamensis]